MKKIFYILIIIFVTGNLSCTKFLEEENPSGITNETYYVDAAGFEALVNASYQSLRTVYNTNPSLFEWGTDIMTRGSKELINGGADVVPGTQLNEYKTLSANNIDIRDFFTRIYAGIQRCNTGINRTKTISGLAERYHKASVSLNSALSGLITIICLLKILGVSRLYRKNLRLLLHTLYPAPNRRSIALCLRN